MSKQYPGGIISKTAPVPSGPYADSTAPGVWTLEQQAYWQKLGQWPTQGAVNPSAFIENLFSTYLYTGNGGTQTITNGIDLSTNGGLVWIKGRSGSFGSSSHLLQDSVRGFGNLTALSSNASDAQYSSTGIIQSATSSGFTTGGSGLSNASSTDYVAWTFREQPKFFDVVTYTGTGSVQTIAHNLGSVPGCIIVKSTSNAGTNWAVYHRSVGATGALFLQLTNATNVDNDFWNDTTPTSTVFTVRASSATNATGYTYVAYLFAHDAGGFGLSGSENVISCGSFTPDAGGSATVTLGWEPQWILVKVSGTTGNWTVIDNMRDWSLGGNSTGSNDYLRPNTSGAELEAGTGFPTATGFFIDGVVAASQPHIYIAIRRGPMKVPTSGTSVYKGTTYSGTGAVATISGIGFSPDMVMTKPRSPDFGYYGTDYDRLRGVNQRLSMNTTDAESTVSGVSAFNMDGYSLGTDGNLNNSSSTYVSWNFKRAPSFFDEVCYTGTGVARTVTHNLSVVPEMMIVKRRDAAGAWRVYVAPLGPTQFLGLDSSNAADTSSVVWDATTPTSSVFSVATNGNTNASGGTFVAYLFATCAGVSKVGSYTGTGAAQTINCGFTAGTRFVFIKRTDSTGNWYIWDSTRGIVPSNDPYLFIDIDDAEVTGTDYIDTTSVGFDITSTAPAAINANGGTFIFLAIA